MKEYKTVSSWYIGAYVLYVITGLVMIIWPNLTLDLLGKALGIGMLVVGIVHIILYFTKDHVESIMHMDLTIGVVLAAFGAFMLMHSDFVEMAIPFGIGILLLIGGISKIQYALDIKRIFVKHWQILLVIAVILICAGMVLIYNPFREQALLYFIAGFLIADGLISIFCILFISNRMKKLSKGWMPKHMKAEPGSPGGPYPGQGERPVHDIPDMHPGGALEVPPVSVRGPEDHS